MADAEPFKNNRMHLEQLYFLKFETRPIVECRGRAEE